MVKKTMKEKVVEKMKKNPDIVRVLLETEKNKKEAEAAGKYYCVVDEMGIEASDLIIKCWEYLPGGECSFNDSFWGVMEFIHEIE